MKQFRKWLKRHGRATSLTIIAVALCAWLLLAHLGDLTNGLSSREVNLANQTRDLGTIIQNPVGLPLTILQWIAGWLPFEGTIWLRLPSVIIGGIAILAMAYVLRRWYGPRTALFGTVLFLTSAWFLHVARLATFDILLLAGPLVLLASHVLLHERGTGRFVRFGWPFIQFGLLYIPGMIWFLLLNFLWQRQDIKKAFAQSSSWWERSGLAVSALVLLAPLVAGLWIGDSRQVALSLAGLPASLPSAGEVLSTLGHNLLFIGIYGTAEADMWLNHLAIFGVFMAVMIVLGAYFYIQHSGARRTRLLASFGLLGLILASLTGPVTVGIVVAWCYLVAAAGIAYLLHLWLKVFPKNPVARNIGIGAIVLVVSVSCVYNLRQYFLAWPRNPATQAVFEPHKIPRSHL